MNPKWDALMKLNWVIIYKYVIYYYTDLKTKQAVNDYLANNPGAYQVGDYIVVPRSTYIDYYLVNGAEDPCNPYNNASDYPNPTASNQYFSGVATTEMQIITDPALDILPDCNSLTTNIEWTYSVPITGPTTVAVQASGSSAATTSVCVVTTAGLFALNIGYCLAGWLFCDNNKYNFKNLTPKWCV